MEISAIKGRSRAMEEGHWVDGLPGFPGVRLLVRSATAPMVRQALSKALRDVPQDKLQEDGSIPDDLSTAIDAEVLSSVGLLGWEGITDNGKAVKFNAKVACDLILNAWQFREAVTLAMRRVMVDYDAKTKAIEGN